MFHCAALCAEATVSWSFLLHHPSKLAQQPGYTLWSDVPIILSISADRRVSMIRLLSALSTSYIDTCSAVIILMQIRIMAVILLEFPTCQIL